MIIGVETGISMAGSNTGQICFIHFIVLMPSEKAWIELTLLEKENSEVKLSLLCVLGSLAVTSNQLRR